MSVAPVPGGVAEQPPGPVAPRDGSPGTERRGRCISLPGSRVRVAFHQIGRPVDMLDRRVAHPGGVLFCLPFGWRQDGHEPGGAPVGADDQVALPVARTPAGQWLLRGRSSMLIMPMIGALRPRGDRWGRGCRVMLGAQHEGMLAQRRARHGTESRCRIASPDTTGVLDVSRTVLVLCVMLRFRSSVVLVRLRSGCGSRALSEAVCDCMSVLSRT